MEIVGLIKATGMRSKLKLVSNMLLKPFDSHFADILERFDMHVGLFQAHMQASSAVEALAFYRTWREKMGPVLQPVEPDPDAVNEQQRHELGKLQVLA